MTGTAVAVAEELHEFYKLAVGGDPTNPPCIREDPPDRIYATAEEKEQAIVAHVAEIHATGSPVLLGTQDVAESERLAGALRAAGLSASCSTPATTPRRPRSWPRRATATASRSPRRWRAAAPTSGSAGAGDRASPSSAGCT